MLRTRGKLRIVNNLDGNILRNALVIGSDGLALNNFRLLVFRLVVAEDKHPIFCHSLLAENNSLAALNDEISKGVRRAFAKFPWMFLRAFGKEAIFAADHHGNLARQNSGQGPRPCFLRPLARIRKGRSHIHV